VTHRSFLRLTVENSSSVPIDFVKVTFEDSTTREAQAVIAEGELTPEQAFEIEGDMLNRPVFVWEDGVAGANCSIASGGRRTLTIRCLGKIGWWVFPLWCTARILTQVGIAPTARSESIMVTSIDLNQRVLRNYTPAK